MKIKRQTIFLNIMFIFLSMGTAYGLRAWLHPPLHLQATKLLPEPIDMQGQSYKLTVIGDDTPVYLRITTGYWVLMYFGYSSCMDDCSRTLHELAQMQKKFEGIDEQYLPKVAFVGLDPRRDKIDKLNDYVENFGVDILSITGHNDELARLAHFFGVTYSRTVIIDGKEYVIKAGETMPVNSGDDYQVDHPSQIFILDPQRRYIGSFEPPYNADVLYADMQQLIHQTWRYHIQR